MSSSSSSSSSTSWRLENGNLYINRAEANPCITCFLCGGYFRKPVTICECLHTFCKSCLTRFIADNTSKCPCCNDSLGFFPEEKYRADPVIESVIAKLHPDLAATLSASTSESPLNSPEYEEEKGRDLRPSGVPSSSSSSQNSKRKREEEDDKSIAPSQKKMAVREPVKPVATVANVATPPPPLPSTRIVFCLFRKSNEKNLHNLVRPVLAIKNESLLVHHLASYVLKNQPNPPSVPVSSINVSIYFGHEATPLNPDESIESVFEKRSLPLPVILNAETLTKKPPTEFFFESHLKESHP